MINCAYIKKRRKTSIYTKVSCLREGGKYNNGTKIYDF